MADRFVMAIPSVSPDVAIDNSSWIPPFLPAIPANPRNRLKAYIIAGQADKLALHLYDNYRPCSFDASALSSSVHVVKQACSVQYPYAVFRPWFSDKSRQRCSNETETETIADEFAQMGSNVSPFRCRHVLRAFKRPRQQAHS